MRMRTYHSLTALVFLVAAGAGTAQAQSPVITPGGIVNAASSQPLTTQGALISIFGTNLSPVTDQATSIPWPAQLDGVRVTVNGAPCPLYVVSSGQINAQIPWEAVAAAPPTSNTVVVSTQLGGASAAVPFTLGTVAPAVFTFGYGPGQAIAYNYSDGTFASTGAIANFPTLPFRPVKINDQTSPLIIYATGLGQTNPPAVTGASPTALSSTVATPTVTVGGVAAQVLFSGLSPYPGVYQLNVIVSPGTPIGTQPLVISLGGVSSRSPDVTIGVSN
jgi:uncharacterized protein (TIGR03437 family)